MCIRDRLTAAEQYGRIMIAGGVIQVLSCGLAPILRNENRQVGAMTIMVLGFLFNLTMDFVLLYFFRLGIGGAALASLGAQLLTTVLCFLTLFGVTAVSYTHLALENVRCTISGLSYPFCTMSIML